MKKRILVLLLALVMVAGFALPAVATEGEGAIVSDEPVVITDEVTPAPTETPAPAADETEADALLAAVSLSDGDAPAAATTESVTYVDASGNTQTVNDYTVVTGDMTTLGAGWYVVKDNVTIKNYNPYLLEILGHVNLILCDGATLTVEGDPAFNGYLVSIEGDSNRSLTIYGQSYQTGTLKASGSDCIMGICCNGSMTVNGGVIEVSIGDAGEGHSVIEGDGGMTLHNGTIKVSGGGETGAFQSGDHANLALPTSYYWRTAADGKYRSQNVSYTDNDLEGQYFEVTTTTPATDDLYSVEYVDWNSTTNTLNTTPKKCYDPIKITSDMTTLGAIGAEKWYCVEADTTISNKVTINGNVHLILCDGKTLTVNGGIEANADDHLYIYGQSGQTGALTCSGMAMIHGPGSVGQMTINGGKVNVTGCVTIEGNSTGSGGSLTVNGGSLSVTNGGGDGILIMKNTNPSTMTINGGKVNVTGRVTIEGNSTFSSCSLTVNGGSLNVTNNSGDGIRIGSAGASYTNPGTMTINGGTVTAKSTQDGNKAIYQESGMKSGRLDCPSSYYWSTAADGNYKTQKSFTDNALAGQYFELTTTTPTGNIEPYVTGATATVTYGDALDGSVIKATPDVSGTFAWKSDVTGYGDVGTRTLTAVFTPSDESYVSVDVNVSVTVEPKTIGIDWTDTKLTHNGKAQKPTATATGLVNGDQCTITVTGEQTEAGTYTATATGLDNPNYKLPQDVTCEFTIAAKPAEGKKEPPKTEKAPQTGDAGVALYVISALSSMSGLAWLGRKKKR